MTHHLILLQHAWTVAAHFHGLNWFDLIPLIGWSASNAPTTQIAVHQEASAAAGGVAVGAGSTGATNSASGSGSVVATGGSRVTVTTADPAVTIAALQAETITATEALDANQRAVASATGVINRSGEILADSLVQGQNQVISAVAASSNQAIAALLESEQAAQAAAANSQNFASQIASLAAPVSPGQLALGTGQQATTQTTTLLIVLGGVAAILLLRE